MPALAAGLFGHDLANHHALVFRQLNVMPHFRRHRPAQASRSNTSAASGCRWPAIRRGQLRRFRLGIRGADANDLGIGLRLFLLSTGNRPGAEHEPHHQRPFHGAAKLCY